MVTINTPAELRLMARFLIDLAALREGGAIKPEDAPDWPSIDVGGAAAPVPPLPAPAPSTAGVAAPPTVPEASQVFVPPQPPAISSPVPSPAPAAAVPPVPTPSPAADVRDSAGLPWDKRIHAETRARNADGTWRQRRNLDPAAKAAVEAELRGAPPMPPTAAPVPMPPTAAAGAPGTLPDLMLQLSPHIASGALTLQAITDACVAAGVPSLALLGARPELIPVVWMALQT